VREVYEYIVIDVDIAVENEVHIFYVAQQFWNYKQRLISSIKTAKNTNRSTAVSEHKFGITILIYN